MAQIFESVFMKKEFDHFYQVLILNLSQCDNCGVLKCFYCNKFTASCFLCRTERCKNCFKFNNTAAFFYEHCSEEQWSYICNFLYDLFHISRISRWYFKDISRPINSSITNTSFIISSSDPIKKKKKKKTIYYMLGNRKYKFYNSNL